MTQLPYYLSSHWWIANLSVALDDPSLISLKRDIDNCNFDLQNQQVLAADVSRTRQTYTAFKDKSTNMQLNLSRVLTVFCKRHNINQYKQGIHELAAPFFFLEPPLPPFIILRCLEESVKRAFPYVLCDDDLTAVKSMCAHLKLLVGFHMPDLARHFSKAELNPDVYAFRWLATGFAASFTSVHMLLMLWAKTILEPMPGTLASMLSIHHISGTIEEYQTFLAEHGKSDKYLSYDIARKRVEIEGTSLSQSWTFWICLAWLERLKSILLKQKSDDILMPLSMSLDVAAFNGNFDLASEWCVDQTPPVNLMSDHPLKMDLLVKQARRFRALTPPSLWLMLSKIIDWQSKTYSFHDQLTSTTTATTTATTTHTKCEDDDESNSQNEAIDDVSEQTKKKLTSSSASDTATSTAISSLWSFGSQILSAGKDFSVQFAKEATKTIKSSILSSVPIEQGPPVLLVEPDDLFAGDRLAAVQFCCELLNYHPAVSPSEPQGGLPIGLRHASRLVCRLIDTRSVKSANENPLPVFAPLTKDILEKNQRNTLRIYSTNDIPTFRTTLSAVRTSFESRHYSSLSDDAVTEANMDKKEIFFVLVNSEGRIPMSCTVAYNVGGAQHHPPSTNHILAESIKEFIYNPDLPPCSRIAVLRGGFKALKVWAIGILQLERSMSFPQISPSAPLTLVCSSTSTKKTVPAAGSANHAAVVALKHQPLDKSRGEELVAKDTRQHHAVLAACEGGLLQRNIPSGRQSMCSSLNNSTLQVQNNDENKESNKNASVGDNDVDDDIFNGLMGFRSSPSTESPAAIANVHQATHKNTNQTDLLSWDDKDDLEDALALDWAKGLQMAAFQSNIGKGIIQSVVDVEKQPQQREGVVKSAVKDFLSL